MRYLALYTPYVKTAEPPSPTHMAQMGALVTEMMQAGTLLDTGPLARRETGGLRVSLRDDAFTVEDAPEGESVLLSASGYALLQAGSREELTAAIRRFLQTAGEGTVEIIQIADMPAMAAVAE